MNLREALLFSVMHKCPVRMYTSDGQERLVEVNLKTGQIVVSMKDRTGSALLIGEGNFTWFLNINNRFEQIPGTG